MRSAILAFVLILFLPAASDAVVIGHAEVEGATALPVATCEAIAGQRWLFAHASVGGNIIGGMQTLHAEDPSRYPLVFATAGTGSQILPPPAETVPGTVYDGVRGNPGWLAKYQMFDGAVRNLGWHDPLLDAAMDKLCYIDPSADVSVYLASMTALEADFPGTRFVYVTMPLQSSSGANASNMLAFAYNEAVRAHCAGPDRLLYDLADIESHDPDGNAITFTVGEQVYQRLYSGYTSDGGHLNSVGARRAALGWYAAAAAIAGGASAVEPAPAATGARITATAPNPFNPITTLSFVTERDGFVAVDVYDARGRRIDRLLAGELEAGEHRVVWRGTDLAGRPVPSGTYLVRLVAGGEAVTRSLSLVR